MKNSSPDKKIDPDLLRFAFFLQAVVIFAYSFIASQFFGFERPNSLLFIMVALGVILELSLQFLKYKKLRFPSGAIITALSCSLLIDATNPDPYIFAVILAILSKRIFYNETGHYFNPANFGVVLVLIFYSGNINLSSAIFAGSIYLSLIFFIFGLIIASLAGQIYVSALWIINFAIFALIRANFSIAEFFANLSALSSVAMLLFMFNMITDPKTCPKSLAGKFYYTFSIALIDAIFRWLFIPYGNFYGLFFISALIPIIANKISLKKAYGLFFVIVVFVSLMVKTFLLPPKGEREFEERYKEIIFINDSDKITPRFTHQDNLRYYEGQKYTAFRSLFFAPGIAITDLNFDGYQDFIIINSKADSLPEFYINENGHKFRKNESFLNKKILPKSDPYDLNVSPFLGDFDGDGDLDLFISSVKCNKLFTNHNQKFTYQKDHPLSKDCNSSFSALPHHFDSDKKSDLLVIRYWNNLWQKIFEERSQEIFTKNLMELFKNGNVVFNGANGGESPIYFSDKTSLSLNEDQKINWSFDATISDLDNNGTSELILANDFGNDRIYNIKDKKLTEVTNNFKSFDRRNGMSASTSYLPNDPYPFLFISNIWIENYQEKGNFYWQYDQNQKQLINKSEKSKLDNCKWAWGSAFADFNMDGYNDSYVANGYISFNEKKGSSRESGFKSAYFQTLPSSAQIKKFFTTENQTKRPIRGNEIFLTDGQGQRDCMRIYSPLTGEFHEAKKDKSLDFGSDSRAVAKIDFDNDGDLDLLVTRQNNNLLLLKNITQEKAKKNNWIGLNIENHHFIKKITAKQGDNTYYKDWTAGRSGFLATSDPRVYMTFKNASKVTIEIQMLDNRIISKELIPGKYYNLGKI